MEKEQSSVCNQEEPKVDKFTEDMVECYSMLVGRKKTLEDVLEDFKKKDWTGVKFVHNSEYDRTIDITLCRRLIRR